MSGRFSAARLRWPLLLLVAGVAVGVVSFVLAREEPGYALVGNSAGRALIELEQAVLCWSWALPP